jgi:7-keto-8-aminopelargonate synthetase-like enzyme
MVEPEPLSWIGKNEVRWRDRRLVYFSGCDYFRLARDRQVAAAMQSALKHHGLNVAASRVTTGNHSIYHTLESALAKFFGAGAALLLPDGYLAPLAVTQALGNEYTHVLVDELAHGALRDAACLAGCPVEFFKHRDSGDLARLIRQCGKKSRPLILTDGLFAHDGSVAPLRSYLKILPSRGLILVDDAHGGGVLGKNGQGPLEHENVGRGRIIQCLTLSKAFGVFGGVVLASPALRQKIVSRSWIFKGTTPLPPPLAGAALMSLKILRDEPQRRRRLEENTLRLRASLRAAGWPMADRPGPIVRLPPLSASAAGLLKKRLLAANIFPPFINYGPAAPGAFRFVVSSEHTRPDLERVARVLTDFKRSRQKWFGRPERLRHRNRRSSF